MKPARTYRRAVITYRRAVITYRRAVITYRRAVDFMEAMKQWGVLLWHSWEREPKVPVSR